MDHRDYLRQIASKGGKAGTGKAKARSPEQARKAAEARWSRRSNRKPDGKA
ncbi:MAG TPA: hypothetical protein VHD61_15670 [Lacunisphaera sp.]|nr:hypothetical protein [Lacunisphaera sp.]